ncbi:Hypothetical predicted protein [Octopus vulgaris]|uniref:Uncharacterized protein n=1 Tax=Octopus vulgaris TaxID=6645 RepID=A0AA36APB5_OCTVU|nr:Hypothetical predicted protein [Octopus vulgaris]
MNEDKCVYSTTVLDFLGYRISHNILSPDPERLDSLLNLRTATDQKALKRIVGGGAVAFVAVIVADVEIAVAIA